MKNALSIKCAVLLLLIASSNGHCQNYCIYHLEARIPLLRLISYDNLPKLSYSNHFKSPPIFLNNILIPELVFSAELSRFLLKSEIIDLIHVKNIRRVDVIKNEETAVRLNVPLGTIFIKAHERKLTKILNIASGAQY